MNDVIVNNQPHELAEELYLGKVVRDGKVAVLFSPGFGAGWSSWNSELGEDIIFDPTMVKYVEEGNMKALQTYVAMKYPSAYAGGIDNLAIAWITEGTLFRIDEYDGNESIEILGESTWIKA